AAIEATNAEVWTASRSWDRRGMGATLAAVLVTGLGAFVASVGDSRVYLVRRNEIGQLTRDQSVVEMLVSTGQLTREQAASSPHRNAILQAIGPRPTVSVPMSWVKLRRDDIFVLCSDGLTTN